MTKPHIPLDEIRAQVEGCRKCPLADGRTQTVFGVGNPEARVMIIGEAPGKNEDLQGEPFVGAAGKYLNELLAVAGLVREDVFIANVLKCRPPGNRDPRPEEIELCTPYLREQTRTIDPEFLVTLGNFLHEVHPEDGYRHHTPARHRAARRQVQGVPHLPPGGRAVRRFQARGAGERLRHAGRAVARKRSRTGRGGRRQSRRTPHVEQPPLL